MQQPIRVHPPAVHFNYDDLDGKCGCALCRDYEESVARLAQCRKDTRGHPASCPCWLCKSKQDALIERRMANNKRDLYSELSFLTSGHKFGPTFLRWVYSKIDDEKFHTPQWWADEAPLITLKTWMDDWQKSHIAEGALAVSGLY